MTRGIPGHCSSTQTPEGHSSRDRYRVKTGVGAEIWEQGHPVPAPVTYVLLDLRTLTALSSSSQAYMHFT